MPNLRLYFLGMPLVEVDGQRVDPQRRKPLALLAYLALTPGAHRRDTLAALLWPGYAAATSRGNVRRTLSELNSSLAGAGLEIGRETPGVIGPAPPMTPYCAPATTGTIRCS